MLQDCYMRADKFPNYRSDVTCYIWAERCGRYWIRNWNIRRIVIELMPTILGA